MENIKFIIGLVFIAGCLIGVLRERWVYFNKTGKHLQNISKNKTQKLFFN